MERSEPRAPVHAGQPASLRDLGYDERWLQDWLVAEPTRLGLGQVAVLAQELSHPRGGSLDILAADGDTYYSVEVQLVQELLRASFEILEAGTSPWSERHPQLAMVDNATASDTLHVERRLGAGDARA
jgi:hypothetical protein